MRTTVHSILLHPSEFGELKCRVEIVGIPLYERRDRYVLRDHAQHFLQGKATRSRTVRLDTDIGAETRTVFINCTSSKEDSTIARLSVTRRTSTGSSGIGAGLLQFVVVIAGTVMLMCSELDGVGCRLGSFLGLGHGGVDK